MGLAPERSATAIGPPEVVKTREQSPTATHPTHSDELDATSTCGDAKFDASEFVSRSSTDHTCQEVVAHIVPTTAVFAIDTEYNTVDKMSEMGNFRFLEMESFTMILDDQGPRNFGNKRHLSSVF